MNENTKKKMTKGRGGGIIKKRRNKNRKNKKNYALCIVKNEKEDFTNMTRKSVA